MQLAIYGAKSLALGMYRAIEKLYPEEECIGFVVNSRKGNPFTLAGLPVIEMEELKERIAPENRDDLHILVCTPEDLHPEISAYIEENGFSTYTCMNSKKEAKLMEDYFVAIDRFKSLHRLPSCANCSDDMDVTETDKFNQTKDSATTPSLHVYQAKFYKDRPLKNAYEPVDWMIPIQVGAALTDVRVTDVCDNQGENISEKNVNYCELTALYWMWKNKLIHNDKSADTDCDSETSDIVAPAILEDYYGLFHYRRILDISEEDIKRIAENDIDIVVSYPTLHEPDIVEHHARYIKESDWEAMLAAVGELYPDYREAYNTIFAQEYMYNYNMIVAKKSVLRDYCDWLFPILERTEELSTPKGWERKDRYIGYLGENLMTLYFFYNRDKYNIVHTGRIMLT